MEKERADPRFFPRSSPSEQASRATHQASIQRQVLAREAGGIVNKCVTRGGLHRGEGMIGSRVRGLNLSAVDHQEEQ